jgi:hypothetical protein
MSMSKTNSPATVNDKGLNREAWLTAFAKAIAPVITQRTGVKVDLTKTRLSCSFPRTRATPSRKTGKVTIGQCLMGHKSGLNEIMISPLRDTIIAVNAEGEGHGIAETIIHELLHAALPLGTGHKAPFARAAKAMGLEGRPTETFAGTALVELIREVAAPLGEYPHRAIDGEWGKKQTTRLLKVMCLDCGFMNEAGNGYTTRTTMTWVEVGLPVCPCGNTMSLIEKGEESTLVALKPVDSHCTYRVPNKDSTDYDPRFQIRRTSSEHGGDRWTVIDYGAPVKRQAIVDGEVVEVESTNFETSTRIVAAESRQDALDMIDAIREDLFDWDYLEDDQDDWEDEGEDDGSNPLADEDPDLDALLFIGDDEDETPEYPEDAEPEQSWTRVHPTTKQEFVHHFDYEVISEAREAAGTRKSAQIAAGTEAAMD